MIKNERQYRITAAQVERFERALDRLRARPASPDANERALQQLEEAALVSQLDDLRQELRDYDALRSGERTVITAASFHELPRALIEARIARGLSQRALAERLGLKEQQVQRYEATDYAGASLARVAQVIDALGVEVHEAVIVPARASA
jgi:ribosome-binding protein aMBF1 (putative translation factor)